MINEFFKIVNGTGERFTYLPYEVRAVLFEKLNPVEFEDFRIGRASTDVLNKAQTIYDNWYKDTHPTEEVLFNRMAQAKLRDRTKALQRQLNRAKERLQKLDRMAKNDVQLPVGEREKLRKEIANLESSLKVRQSINQDIQEKDWLDDFLK